MTKYDKDKKFQFNSAEFWLVTNLQFLTAVFLSELFFQSFEPWSLELL